MYVSEAVAVYNAIESIIHNQGCLENCCAVQKNKK